MEDMYVHMRERNRWEMEIDDILLWSKKYIYNFFLINEGCS